MANDSNIAALIAETLAGSNPESAPVEVQTASGQSLKTKAQSGLVA
jgi:hypothetical protein